MATALSTKVLGTTPHHYATPTADQLLASPLPDKTLYVVTAWFNATILDLHCS